jgi:hypothetical protein
MTADVFSLHQSPAHPIGAGARAAPAPSDARWARRQHSHIWAPELQSYDFSDAGGRRGGDPYSGALLSELIQPIAETAIETGALFLPQVRSAQPLAPSRATARILATTNSSSGSGSSSGGGGGGGAFGGAGVGAQPKPGRARSIYSGAGAKGDASDSGGLLLSMRGVNQGILETENEEDD